MNIKLPIKRVTCPFLDHGPDMRLLSTSTNHVSRRDNLSDKQCDWNTVTARLFDSFQSIDRNFENKKIKLRTAVSLMTLNAERGRQQEQTKTTTKSAAAISFVYFSFLFLSMGRVHEIIMTFGQNKNIIMGRLLSRVPFSVALSGSPRESAGIVCIAGK